MSKNTNCPIWDTPTTIISSPDSKDMISVNSQRAGGKYLISIEAEAMLESCDERLKAKLTSWLVEQRWLGQQGPEIFSTTIDEAKERKVLSVFERASRTLKYLESQTSYIGDVIELFRAQGTLDVHLKTMSRGDSIDETDKSRCFVSLNLQAFSESTNLEEVAFLLRYLNSQRWLDHTDSRGLHKCELTVEGYTRLAELEKRDTQSSRAFVAMWFDKSMDDLWEKGIKPGIEDAGYEAVRIDRKEHVNKIDDEIIAEIKRSRFVVADFTHGTGGMRGGVYYEAGFAHGMNNPVIFSCREDIIDDIHFDTRQYNHIVWKTPEDLKTRLTNRIAAVVGDGPKKNAVK